MATRPGLTTERVVAAAVELLDSGGLQALTLASLAQRLQVRSPSLYNHIDGLDDLRRRLTLRGLLELRETLQTAVMGRSGSEALAALGHAYRDFARHHPGLYQLTLRSNEQGDPELQQAGAAVVEVVLAVLRAYDLHGDAALHATRFLRSALHGFVSLEIGGGFGLPLALDESFAALLGAVDRGLRHPDAPAALPMR